MMFTAQCDTICSFKIIYLLILQCGRRFSQQLAGAALSTTVSPSEPPLRIPPLKSTTIANRRRAYYKLQCHTSITKTPVYTMYIVIYITLHDSDVD